MEKIVVTAVLIIGGVAAALVAVFGLGSSASIGSQSVAEAQREDALRTRTRIEVIGVASRPGGTKVDVWIKNVGVAPIYSIDKADIFLIKSGKIEAAFTYNNDGMTSKSWFGDLQEAGSSWNRGETLHVTATLCGGDRLVGTGDYILRVSTPNGKTAEKVFGTYPGSDPDALPPAAPTNLVATGVGLQVALDWDDNTEPDLAGYDVYRSSSRASAARRRKSTATRSR